MHNVQAPAQRRAHLIREMARDRANVELDGVPDNTQDHMELQGTESQVLPALPRMTTNKEDTDGDWRINTSALRRAFPNFSQYGSSDEDSIELGRGLHRTTAKSLQSDEPSVSMSLTFPQTGERWKVTDTPPVKVRKTQVAEQGNLRQHDKRSASQPLKATMPSKLNQTRSSIDEEGKQANKTAVETQTSVESVEAVGERPPAINVSVRESRWGNRQKQPLGATNLNTPIKTSGLQQAMKSMADHGPSSAQAPTAQSFLLPDMANITELVSGVRPQGTPLFSRSARPNKRFSNPTGKAQNAKPAYLELDGVPVPTDEKALYASLQILQERVSALESDKAALEQRSEDYELEVLQLRSKLEEIDANRHSDSGVGYDEEETKTREWEQEKSQFAINMKTLQRRLDRANGKLAESEMTIKNLEQDRDSAHAQLLEAQLGSEELKTESRAVSNEITKAKRQVDRLNQQWEKKLEKLTIQEQELRGKISRREKAINEMSVLVRDLWNTRRQISDTATSRPVSRRMSLRQPAQTVDAELSDGESTTDITTKTGKFNLHRDSDYMSFMAGDEIPKLRQVLEEDKARLADGNLPQPDVHHNNVTQPVLPRKSSLKRNRKSVISENNTQDFSVQFGQPTQQSVVGDIESQAAQNTQYSSYSRRSRQDQADDMTSAIILPDITLTGKGIGQTKIIPRPVPVSDRELPAEEDHTLRPAQNPAVALATVLKALEDEIAGLRAQLAKQEALYHKHDPALSKRKRKAVFERIVKLLTAIELKSDQVYALYDVLEGQKNNDEQMEESQVEVTLRDIGIDPKQALAPRSKSRSGSRARAQGGMDAADLEDDDDELPWEGFDTTHSLASLRV